MTNLNADKKWIKGFKSLIKNYEKENTKLKELLKECRALLSCLQIDDYDNNGLLILNRINQALGES